MFSESRSLTFPNDTLPSTGITSFWPSHHSSPHQPTLSPHHSLPYLSSNYPYLPYPCTKLPISLPYPFTTTLPYYTFSYAHTASDYPIIHLLTTTQFPHHTLPYLSSNYPYLPISLLYSLISTLAHYIFSYATTASDYPSIHLLTTTLSPHHTLPYLSSSLHLTYIPSPTNTTPVHPSPSNHYSKWLPYHPPPHHTLP